jgi:peptidoglycan/LPS O-acetylase OafA/YrhL
LKYRAEIDGLRALAVVPVILFHAGFDLFSGGFVGVDVFFVISGYLITTILIEDIENKRFSIVNFYERRARRILPALFFVMLVCIPFAWMWMLPSQMKDFSQSVAAATLFSSNLLFLQEAGYFAELADAKPLLHTWSLAVEEQFYLLFPIFLILAWRLGKNRVFVTLVVMTAVSLLLSEWGWRNKEAANFYLAYSRAWELLAGSMAAFFVHKKGVQKNDVAALSGLAAIVFSIFVYDETTPFPSVYALLPVLGAVLLVMYANSETFAAKLLSTRAFVGIGLISYSAYLWHQPIFAFMIINGVVLDGSTQFITVFSLIGLLSYLSWRLLEKPFRNSKLVKKSTLIITGVSISLFLILFGIFGHLTQGYKFRYSKEDMSSWVLGTLRQDYEVSTITKAEAFSIIGISPSSKWSSASVVRPYKKLPSSYVLILGDSHAGHLRHGFAEVLASELNTEVHFLNSTGCIPLTHHFMVYDLSRRSELPIQEACRDQIIAWEKFLRKNNEKYNFVILSARWNHLVNDEKYGNTKIQERSLFSRDDALGEWQEYSVSDRIEKLTSGFSDTATFFKQINVKLHIITQPPVQMKDLRLGKSTSYFDDARPDRVKALERHNNTIKAINAANLGDNALISIFDTFSYFCPKKEQMCKNREENSGFYTDDDHLSAAGSEKLGRLFLKRLNTN